MKRSTELINSRADFNCNATSVIFGFLWLVVIAPNPLDYLLLVFSVVVILWVIVNDEMLESAIKSVQRYEEGAAMVPGYLESRESAARKKE